MNIHVGNMAFDVTEADLRAAFEVFGTVTSVKLITDQFTGQSKGFCFVEMPSASEAQAAINGLNGKELLGRAMSVSVARPRESGGRAGRRPGGGGGGYRARR